MFSCSYSAVLTGMEANIIKVEADVSDGLPMFSLVGYLSAEAKEAKDRVRISIKNSGFKIPVKKIIINLSPADIRKEGTVFDLAVAVSVLTAFGYILKGKLEKIMLIGELSLDGTVHCVSGVLPMVYQAKREGFHTCIVPKENAKEGAMVEGIDVIGISSLREVVSYFREEKKIIPTKVDTKVIKSIERKKVQLNFSDVVGQESIKRVIEIAVAGMHNLLMTGPTGVGKTMLAKRIASIMPKMTFEESMEVSKIYSVAGLLEKEDTFVLQRPFRAPHHSITANALVGGGRVPRPGEISLAHRGVLFLDELTEFGKDIMGLLRQPLEEGYINISRLNGNYQYPSDFMLIAAMNPCNCGYYPDRLRCNCSINQVKRYLGKISRALLDRIDMFTEIFEVEYKEMQGERRGESSEAIRKRIESARKIQRARYRKEGILFNSQLDGTNIRKYCDMGKEEEKLMEQAFQKYNLSARGYHKILKVARTIADLDGEEKIKVSHLSEAVCYRSIDKKYWN